MTEFFQRIAKYYVLLYQWIPILLALVIILTLYFCKVFFDRDQTAYFQTIFVGLVAFGIPFMWNAYQRILEIKNKSIGDKIEHILSKEYYQKANRYFEAILLFPTALLIFCGLILSPFLSLFWDTCLIIASVIFFIYHPRIFSWIEDLCSINLRRYI